MAFSSFKSYLMYKQSGTYTKLIDIKDFPDLGSAPEQLDATTLSDKMRVYCEGIQDNEQKSFTANYVKADASTIEGLAGVEQDLAVWLGATESGGVYTPDGSDGKWEFKGYVSWYKNGAGVNEVQDMTVVVTPSTGITFS